MNQIFFVPCTISTPAPELDQKIALLWQRAGFDDIFHKNDLAALKLHLGEPGCNTALPPTFAAALVRQLQATGARPFLTDTAVLYRSPRDNGVGHALVAQQHGFGLEAMGAPFLPADGLNGSDDLEIPVEGARHYEKAAIAAAITQARSILCLTHATGHLGTGFGGVLKNLGMGCSSKRGKLRLHHGQQPKIKAKACTACGTCFSWCPSGAIILEEVASIDKEKCIGCGECIAVCQEGAVRFSWGIMGRELQERIVEYAAAVVRGKPGAIAYFTVLCNVTKDCDCLGITQRPLVQDMGLLAGRDPVALDHAALALIARRAGQSLESLSYPQHNGSLQIQYAEALGLGSTSYELTELEA